MGYGKEEKALIWLDSFSLDYAKKAAALSHARDPYALVARFSEDKALSESWEKRNMPKCA